MRLNSKTNSSSSLKKYPDGNGKGFDPGLFENQLACKKERELTFESAKIQVMPVWK
jgi:hypothetical protein